MAQSLSHSLAAILGLGLGALSGGCSDATVVAEVGKTKLSQADLAAFAEQRKHGSPDVAALNALVDRQVLAVGGLRTGLEKDPVVAARIASAQREVLAEAYLEERLRALTTEEALRARYEQEQERLKQRRVHVQQISILLGPGEGVRRTLVAQAKANQLYARALHGEDFGALAREGSDDTASRDEGGDLGWVAEGQVAPVFFEAAEKLHRGDLSPPVETAFGFHLIRAVEEPQEVAPLFKDVRPKLLAEARTEGEAAVLTELRSQIGVQLHPERVVPSKGTPER
jgi:peptidyl-prolyl cis-trans isomerase C